jgi:hypothetical protein
MTGSSESSIGSGSKEPRTEPNPEPGTTNPNRTRTELPNHGHRQHRSVIGWPNGNLQTIGEPKGKFRPRTNMEVTVID